ncbi:MAG: FliH/SctL family protein [Myxococcota bacterium]
MRSSFEEQPLYRGGEFVADGVSQESATVSAEDEIAHRIAAACEQARRETRAEVEAEWQQRAAEQVRAFEAAAEAVQRLDADGRKEIGEALISLSIAIAEHVLRQELRAHPDALFSLLDEALDSLAQRGETVIELASETLGDLRERHAEALHRLEQTWDARFAADASLAAGDARVVSEQQQVSLAIEPLLARIGEALRNPPVDEEDA